MNKKYNKDLDKMSVKDLKEINNIIEKELYMTMND